MELKKNVLNVIVHKKMMIRNINKEDSQFAYDCRNDDESRKYARTMHKITLEEHAAWFDKMLSETFYVGELNHRKVGVIRFTSESPPEIAIHLHPSMRGQGYGTILLKESMDKYLKENPTIETLMCTIKPENKASVRIFEKVGFKPTGELDPKDESCDVYLFEARR